MLTSFKRFRHSSLKSLPAAGRGFTLIEMLMVVAIICIVSLVLFVRQNSFDSSTLLRSLAYSIALSFEQAQTYGTSVRGFTPTGGAIQFAPGYGVYFSAASPTSFNLFADYNPSDHCRAGDTACPANAGTEDLPAYAINRGYQIYNFCGIRADNSATLDCANSTQGIPAGYTVVSTISSLAVYFKRPDPDAYFYSSNSSGATGVTYNTVFVELVSIDNANTANARTVKITPTGEITVCTLGADPVTGC